MGYSISLMLTTFENGQKLQIQFYKNLWYRNRLFGITVRAEILFALSMNTFVVLVLHIQGCLKCPNSFNILVLRQLNENKILFLKTLAETNYVE